MTNIPKLKKSELKLVDKLIANGKIPIISDIEKISENHHKKTKEHKSALQICNIDDFIEERRKKNIPQLSSRFKPVVLALLADPESGFHIASTVSKCGIEKKNWLLGFDINIQFDSSLSPNCFKIAFKKNKSGKSGYIIYDTFQRDVLDWSYI